MDERPPRRERSRSPRRAPKGSRGFRWKDSNRSSENSYDRRDSGYNRGNRDRSRSPRRRRDYDRPRDSGRDRNRDTDRDRDSDRPPRSPRRSESGRKDSDKDGAPKSEKKEKKTPKPAPGPQQEMIIVHINDRLGTKTAVPCLPSDTVGQLKLMIAARIGREAGQIMLRRQGERPFKDQLCLEDYAISNGVQLDLEIDTGD